MGATGGVMPIAPVIADVDPKINSMENSQMFPLVEYFNELTVAFPTVTFVHVGVVVVRADFAL